MKILLNGIVNSILFICCIPLIVLSIIALIMLAYANVDYEPED